MHSISLLTRVLIYVLEHWNTSMDTKDLRLEHNWYTYWNITGTRSVHISTHALRDFRRCVAPI